MIPVTGKDVILQFYDGSDYLDFACITECSIERNTEMVNVRTTNGGRTREIRPKRDSLVVNMSGIVVLDGGRFKAFDIIQEYQQAFLALMWQMIFDSPETGLEKIIRGRSYVERSMLTGPTNGHSIADFTMPVDGDVTYLDSAILCSATIGAIEIGAGDPDSGIQATVSYTGITGSPARLEYSIDGGAREVIFSPGTSGFINLSGLSDGSHTIQVWVVCENGEDGESNELVFDIGGGEPAPACAGPGTITIDDITATTATASWVAASPVPDDGYFWVLLDDTMTVIDDGTTASTSVGLTGLTAGNDYTFRVKSLCETGVSESSFVSEAFSSSAAACAMPGAVTVDDFAEGAVDASWIAASPSPLYYEWRVVLLSDNSVFASGTSASLSTGSIPGLTPGDNYRFDVRSVCTVGVSVSGYSSQTFTAP